MRAFHRFPWTRRLALAALAALAPACAPTARIASDTLVAYTSAVQDEDWDALFCLSAGAADAGELGGSPEQRRQRFGEWAEAWYGRYLEGRDEGRVDVETNPIAVVKLFALGRGAYYEVAGTSEIGDGALRASTPVRFGYEQAALSRLSPGTTFYVADTPLGTVHAVRIPSGSREIDVTALDTVTIEWTLVRAQAAAGCPARWTVAKARPLPETATTTDITWIF